MMKRLNRNSMLFAATMLSMSWAAQAHAQPEASADESASDSMLGEIVVRAQKRDENLQEVPIAITTLNPDQLSTINTTSTADLQQVVPGMRVNTRSSSVMMFLRGVGTSTNSPGLDPAVATYIDDVYSPSAVGANFQFNNIEGIEILRGPQGTLFGRNATGGVINVHTKNPGRETEIDAEVGYGNFDTFSGRLYVNTPLASTAAVNLALVYNNQRDGWGDNSVTGQDVRKGEAFAARGKLLVDIGERTQVRFTGWYSDQENDYGAFSLAPGARAIDGSMKTDGFWDHTSTSDPRTNNEQYGGSFVLDHDLGGAKIVNILAYQHVKAFYRNDSDGLAPVRALAFADFTDKTLTNEFQIVSDNDSAFKWVTGVFLMKQTIDHVTNNLGGSGVTSTPSVLKTTSVAPFAQGTYEIDDRLSVTAGIRYTHDKRRFDASVINPAGAIVPPLIDEEKSWNRVTWRGAIDYKITPDIMLYASATSGFKAGTFSVSSPREPAVEPEIVTAYEAGVKAELFDRRLQLNTAFFYYEYEDLILRGTIPGGTVTRLFNAAQAEVKGVDVDFQAILTKGLRLWGGFEILDAEFTSFPGGIANIPRPGGGNQAVTGQDFSGNRLPFSTKFSGNVGLTYSTPVSFGELTLNGGMSYKSKSYAEPDNLRPQPAFTLFNASASLDVDDFRFSIFGTNLTNKKYYQDLIGGSNGNIYVPGAPRTYGVQVGFKFGG